MLKRIREICVTCLSIRLSINISNGFYIIIQYISGKNQSSNKFIAAIKLIVYYCWLQIAQIQNHRLCHLFRIKCMYFFHLLKLKKKKQTNSIPLKLRLFLKSFGHYYILANDYYQHTNTFSTEAHSVLLVTFISIIVDWNERKLDKITGQSR